jgi:hypothetical protein
MLARCQPLQSVHTSSDSSRMPCCRDVTWSGGLLVVQGVLLDIAHARNQHILFIHA